MEDKLFFYDYDGNLRDRIDTAFLISEVELPSSLEQIDGDCATSFNEAIPIGTVIDLVYGDPIVIPGCKLLSITDEPPDDFPGDRDEFIGWGHVLTFEFQGKRFWADSDFSCRREDYKP